MKHETDRTLNTVWRMESPRIVAAVAKMVRDIGLAEELAQDALVAALEHWPTEGIPDNAGAWLMTTAKRAALDWLRQRALHARKQSELGADADARGDHVVPDFSDGLDEKDDYGDEMLRLVFTACHPLLSRESQVALTLKLIAGLTAQEIARAFVVPEPTIAQRIVRAKRTLSEAHVPYEVPGSEAIVERLSAVLEVIYLIFNEGYSATSGENWTRPGLCEEALRLGRMLAHIAPKESEVHGLVALMEIQSSRLRARTDPHGEPILLMDQDRRLWDRLLIGRGLAALRAAQALGTPPGKYEIQARIAACHAWALKAEDTDWNQIVSLYDQLNRAAPSPIVELNRAVAICMAHGPALALAAVDDLVRNGALKDYHLLGAVRADLLIKLNRLDEAYAELVAAAELATNAREKSLLLQRAQSTRR